MSNPALLSWLIIGHFVGDYLFQTNWMAFGKTQRILPLAIHALVYTISVALLALPAGGLTGQVIIILFLSHMVLDQRSFIRWWVKTVNGKESPGWMNIIVDQTWHLLVLAAVCLMKS